MTEDKLLTPLEVSKMIGKSYKSTLKYIHSKKIPSITKKNEKNIDTFYVKESVCRLYMENDTYKVPQQERQHIQPVSHNNRKENELLREQINSLQLVQTLLVEQIKVKDLQISQFNTIVERLQQTNQYLLLEGDKKHQQEPFDIKPTAQKQPTTKQHTNVDTKSLIMNKSKQGMTDTHIAKWLNENNIPTFSNTGVWHPKSVYRIKKGKK